MSKIFLGIDPGQTGCLAVVIPEIRKVEFFDPLLFEVKSGTKTKHEYDEAAMAAALKNFVSMGEMGGCFLEKVSAMPDQGVTSMFNFGMGFGLWRGMLSALQIPYTLVHPVTWKKLIMRDMGKDKDAARQRAIQLYPEVSTQLARKKDIGRADALLIAHYGIATSGITTP